MWFLKFSIALKKLFSPFSRSGWFVVGTVDYIPPPGIGKSDIVKVPPYSENFTLL